MADTETTLIKGRGRKTATVLLAAAAQLQKDKRVVRAQLGGYRVPNDVAERYEVLLADLDENDENNPEQAKPAPAKKTAAKKTAAKKTTAKKPDAAEKE